MIVCWLVTPYFDGAFYVYKNLIHPCLSMDLQNVINWLNKRMESLYAKDNFLIEMEKFIKENGPEALEKIIACKSGGTKQNLDVKDSKASPSTENKEVEQLNSERHTVTQKDIRPVEVLEKNEVKAAKQGSRVQPNVTRVENRNFVGPDIKKQVPEGATQRELPQTPSSSKGQKWTCEICRITSEGVTTLNSHLQGQEHKAAVEALKAKNRSSGPKVVPTFIPKNSNVPNVEPTLNSHLQGQEHEAAVEALKAKNRSSGPKVVPTFIPKNFNVPNVEPSLNSHLQGQEHEAAVEALKAKNRSSGPRVVPTFIPKNSNVPNVEPTLNSHLQGQEHEAAVEALKAKNRSSGPKVVLTFIPKNSNVPNVEPGKSGPQKEYSGNAEVRGQQQGIPASVPRKSVQAQQPKKPNIGSIGINKSSLWCSICNVNCTSRSDMASHLRGGRHLAAIQQDWKLWD